jgi:DNA-cytosine methyltransferase
MKINQLDLFSGIGGFHLGFEKAGYKVTSYFSEIDKHAVAVYKNKFKNSNYVGSVTDVRGAELPKIDLITFGSPCQDFSLAGKRKGMEGDRSSLILEAIRLIGECRPRVFIWENVKGTFSSNSGEDFSAIIQAFANIGGYRLEWQLLNTSWFLPQNRERIYLVGYSTEPKRDWRGVFPVGEINRETTSVEVKQEGKNDLILRVKSATSSGYEEATSGDTINLSQPNSETRRGRVGKQKAQTLETSCNQAVVQPNYEIVKQNVWVRKHKVDIEGLQNLLRSHKTITNNQIAKTLNQPITKVEHWFRKDKVGFSIPEADIWNDLKELLNINTTKYDAQVTEFIEQEGKYEQAERIYNTQGVAPSLTLAQVVNIKAIEPNYTSKSLNETIENSNLVKGEPKALDLYNRQARDESPTLTEPHHNSLRLFDGYRIRRLTPIECERLQGFPDDHTAYGNYDGEVKPMSISQRYKQCGNAVTVDVVEAIANKIKPLFK